MIFSLALDAQRTSTARAVCANHSVVLWNDVESTTGLVWAKELKMGANWSVSVHLVVSRWKGRRQKKSVAARSWKKTDPRLRFELSSVLLWKITYAESDS